MRRHPLLAAVAIISLATAACAPRPTADGIVALAPEAGARVELTIAGSPVSPVVLELPARRWVRLAVYQRGVDVTVRLTDPGGVEMLEVDSPTGRLGREPVAFLAERSGAYRLSLDTSGAGELVIEVLEARPERPGDRERQRAFAAFAHGTLHWIEDELEDAERELLRALEGFAAIGGDPAADDARRWLAATIAADGRLEEASTLLREAARGYAERAEEHEEAKCRTELALQRERLGDSATAEGELLRARALFAKAGNEKDLGLVHHRLGALWSDLGRLGEAERAYGAARRLRAQGDDPCDLATTERALGALYVVIGRDREALDELESSYRRAEGCGPVPRIEARIELGWARYLAGDPETGLAHLDEALVLASDRPGSRMAALDRRGTVLTSLGRHDEARASYQGALDLARQRGERLSEADVLANLGQLTLLAGDPARALPYLDRALPLFAAAGEAEAEAYTRLERARALRALARPAPARAELERAIERVETVRAGLASAASRSYFLSHRREIYDELIGLLMDAAATDPASALRALEVAERARARGLVDSVAAPDDRGRAAGEGLGSLMAAIEDLDRQVARLQQKQAPAAQTADAERRLRRLALVAERRAAPPSQPVDRLLAADELAGLLDPDTALLAFALGPAASYAWLVEVDGRVQWFVLPPASTLDALARRSARELAGSRDGFVADSARRASRTLGRALFGEVLPALDRPRLAIVPDGALHLVPFQALPVPGPAGTLLADRAEVVVVPSPSALAAQRARPLPEHRGQLFVVADPVFSAADHRLSRGLATVEAVFPEDLERSLGDLDLGRLRRLSSTRREARAILATARSGETEVLLDFAADRRRVLAADLRRYRALHFATHAILHPSHPQLSGVVLSLVGPDGAPRDGFLRAWEVASLDLPAELVVLSACSTALGREVRAEGFVGLPQAFFRAGARRVVVSHWPVQDRATAELMEAFYEGLFGLGLPPATALARAQARLRADPRWAAPYYWAGFSLQGDWRPLAGQQFSP